MTDEVELKESDVGGQLVMRSEIRPRVRSDPKRRTAWTIAGLPRSGRRMEESFGVPDEEGLN
jgi:hypothetical protein